MRLSNINFVWYGPLSRTGAMFFALVLAGLSTSIAAGAPPAPVWRSYASTETGVTVAMRALVEPLDPRADHAHAGADEDQTCLACVCRAAVAAIRSGDAAGLASLYRDGSKPGDLRGYFAYDAEGRPADPWAADVRVMPIEATHAPWGSRIAVFAEQPDGTSFGVGAFFAELDPATRRWWLTQRIGPADFPFSGSLGRAIEPGDVAGLEAYRLVRTESGTLSAARRDNIPLSPDGNDILVYLDVDRSPAAETPLLGVGAKFLDPSSAQLQRALHLQLLWLNGFDSAEDRMLAEYVPDAREIIRRELLPRRTANNMRTGLVAARGIEATLLLARLRMDARVEVGTGFVWFGRAAWPKPDAGPGAAYVILHQIRQPDGGWSLLLREMDDQDPAAQFCRRLLGGAIEFGEAITRAAPDPGN